MRDTVIPLLGIFLMIIGAELLLEGFAKSDLNDFMRLLSGATCISAGLIGTCLGLRSWWKSRQRELRH
jgi:predicted tellurium resistance membrane protein TerC